MGAATKHTIHTTLTTIQKPHRHTQKNLEKNKKKQIATTKKEQQEQQHQQHTTTTTTTKNKTQENTRERERFFVTIFYTSLSQSTHIQDTLNTLNTLKVTHTLNTCCCCWVYIVCLLIFFFSAQPQLVCSSSKHTNTYTH